jgi:hypothetical protein
VKTIRLWLFPIGLWTAWTLAMAYTIAGAPL